MDEDSTETRELLGRLRRGEAGAFADLFARHRPELTQAIGLRLDRRLTARLDVSDVLQETYLEAVYEAVHLALNRRVALKVLPIRGPRQGGQLERFLREARTAAGLHHTNIVPVFDVG